ncbi:MAG: type II secretion system protein [Rhodocyclales bacterium RIFCSPLOWO2_02_FULL_63_24]|nr:MAG: type II secretion system protein [Rhodocyclales bacterium RIFCSPLOWO2_02_FULL_63_24]
MRFTLKAYRDTEGVIELALDAVDAGAARRQAEAQGYRVLSTNSAEASGRPRLFAGGGFSVPLFAQELLALLEAGLGLVETVALLAHKARHPDAQNILQDLQRRVGEGRSFSQALEAIPAFPPLFVATVRASERSGHLADALRRYLAYQRQLNALRDKVLAASVYPLLLVGVGGLVVLFLLAYVVPRFSRIYEDVGRAHLPLLSRWLMHWGQVAGDHALALGILALVLAGGVVSLLRRPATRAAIERWLWRVPAVGEQLRIYQLARFTRTLAMLLRGGIPLVAALGMVDELLRQPGLQAGLVRARQAISEGRAVSDAFAAQNLATEVGTRLLVVGERSGELGEALERIAGFYDDEIARSVEWFSRLFEPALMMGIGLLIGGIVILMYMPIFELASSIQ